MRADTILNLQEDGMSLSQVEEGPNSLEDVLNVQCIDRTGHTVMRKYNELKFPTLCWGS